MYRIGELAKLADVTADTIRYYEKQGMLSCGERNNSGYRQYSDSDVQRLRFIRYAKTIGFTLEAIKELLSLRIDPAHHTCHESKSIVDSRLEEVEYKLSELARMRDSLKRLSNACCGTSHSSASCSILEALEAGAGKVK